MLYTDIVDGKPRARFQEHERFAYWANNIIQRHQLSKQIKLVMKDETIDENMSV